MKDIPIWISAMNSLSLSCKNLERCYLITKSHPLGEYCKKTKHDKCNSHDSKCNKTAIYGAANSSDRTYCKECFNQLILSETIKDRENYTINNNKCIECKEDFGKNGYCYRSYDATKLQRITRSPVFSCKNCVPIICEKNSFQIPSMISVRVGGSCARRPDMLFEINDTHYVIVEVDGEATFSSFL